MLAARGMGLWHCDLATEKLRWTAGVFDIFGLDRRSEVTRAHAVSLYAPDSREAMARLRAMRSVTGGASRWMSTSTARRAGVARSA
ncbi:hypothetical protein [Sphingobium cloacae]|uniref:hypothetical protein n=1 Tax=Sphingobium cloacae TaxID=120107 RepID=UPI000B0CE827|nr:hypothetical protein [Sphingobium cloacae]